MNSEIIPLVITGLFGLAAALVGFISTRGKTVADRKTALDARIDTRVAAELDRVYARIDEVEAAHTRKMGAVARILRSIARQWPDPLGPDLDPDDLAEVEETIPPAWFRRNPLPKETP